MFNLKIVPNLFVKKFQLVAPLTLPRLLTMENDEINLFINPTRFLSAHVEYYFRSVDTSLKEYKIEKLLNKSRSPCSHIPLIFVLSRYMDSSIKEL